MGKKGDAKRELRNARANLERVGKREKSRGVKGESAAFLRANRRVIAAEKSVSWWRR